jgi:ankyrin repeat protein
VFDYLCVKRQGGRMADFYNGTQPVKFGARTIGHGAHSALYAAAEEGHFEICKRLLYARASVDQRNATGFSPLFAAAMNGHLKVVDLLLSCGAGVNKRDDEHHEVMSKLEMKDDGDSDDGGTDVPELKFRRQGTKTTKVSRRSITSFFSFTGYRHIKNCDASTTSPRSRSTGIQQKSSMAAASIPEILSPQNQCDSIKSPSILPDLLKPLEVQPTHSTLGLMYNGSQPSPNSTSGPENNGCATIRRLQKLDLESEDNKSDNNLRLGITPLIVGIRFGHQEIVERLLQGSANVNQKCQDDKTHFFFAVASGHVQIVQLLLQYDANINVKDVHGLSPRQYALSGEHEQMIQFFQNFNKQEKSTNQRRTSAGGAQKLSLSKSSSYFGYKDADSTTLSLLLSSDSKSNF